MLLSTVKKLKKLTFTKLPRVIASWNCAVSATMTAMLVARRTYDRTDEYPVLIVAIVLFPSSAPGDRRAAREGQSALTYAAKRSRLLLNPASASGLRYISGTFVW